MSGLQVYDISLDEMRPATQADIDQMAKACHYLGLMREVLRKIVIRGENFNIDEHMTTLKRMLDA